MKAYSQVVSKETYDRERDNRVIAAALGLGVVCVARLIEEEIQDGFAIDTLVRVSGFEAANELGQRLTRLTAVDVAGQDLVIEGEPQHGEGLLGPDGIMYHRDGVSEIGYFPGPNTPRNTSQLQGSIDLDVTRQLVSV